jgi:inositol-pentakisphosphate 2-kinase
MALASACVTDTLPSHWEYVSEGGATIVFSYHGPPKPGFDGTVLRLRKSIVPAVSKITRASDLGGQSEGHEDVEEPDDPMIEYQAACMERLIPLEHLPRLESVHVDRAWLEDLIALHDAERPVDRRDKDQVDLTRTKGVLATDLVGGEWLAVEIKVLSFGVMSPIYQPEELCPAAKVGISASLAPSLKDHTPDQDTNLQILYAFSYEGKEGRKCISRLLSFGPIFW